MQRVTLRASQGLFQLAARMLEWMAYFEQKRLLPTFHLSESSTVQQSEADDISLPLQFLQVIPSVFRLLEYWANCITPQIINTSDTAAFQLPSVSEEASICMTWAITAWGWTRGTLVLEWLPRKGWTIERPFFLPPGCKGTPWGTAMGGIFPTDVSQPNTTRNRAPRERDKVDTWNEHPAVLKAPTPWYKRLQALRSLASYFGFTIRSFGYQEKTFLIFPDYLNSWLLWLF